MGGVGGASGRHTAAWGRRGGDIGLAWGRRQAGIQQRVGDGGGASVLRTTVRGGVGGRRAGVQRRRGDVWATWRRGVVAAYSIVQWRGGRRGVRVVWERH